jgi:sentrin-specific protease 7
VKKLLIYPKGRGGISITTYDYYCLAIDTYLNDVIIDFYLKYIHNEKLTEEQKTKTHIFSQFFYKRLTTMTKEKDPKLSAAQKRHQRVQSWTKNVNLFEKDFVIVPINEQSHWFLAIICFPNLTEPHTMDTNLPIKLNPTHRKGSKYLDLKTKIYLLCCANYLLFIFVIEVALEKKVAVQIGNTTITPLTKKEDTVDLNDDHSERDEAEGDESELGSNAEEEEEEEEVVDKGQPVKV